MLVACDRPRDTEPVPIATSAASPFRNVAQPVRYVGDSACVACHAKEAEAWARSAMAQSFQPWSPQTRVETTLATPIVNRPTGLGYSVVEEGGRLWQVETIASPDGSPLHELRRRMDWVAGSGAVARTWFTEENGRLFQLPLTWYKDHGWDFSPGYEVNNARFDRLLPDRCVACHSSFPDATPHLEGKHAWRAGIGCERCHGPGALHVEARIAKAPLDSTVDRTIVNPARLTLDRRMDVCEECHVHTSVAVLREGKTAFSYRPSEPLADQYAYFKVAGSIDVVSHADRLRQSRCFIGTAQSARPLECATCHDPHLPRRTGDARNAPCRECHAAPALQARLASASAKAEHGAGADCVRCHMPRIAERTVPHGAFTEHWIRVVRDSTLPTLARTGNALIEPYFPRDKAGAEAPIYGAMGQVVYATLATDARAMGDAATALDRALGRDTVRREAHFLLGAAYEKVGRTADATRALERAVTIDSNRPDALRALAQSYIRARRDPARVELLFRKALTLQPALAWIRAEYAAWLQEQGRFDDAEREYRAAVAEQPGLASAWFGLGLLATQRGHPDSAAFRQAVHLDPTLTDALSPLVEVTSAGAAVKVVQAASVPTNGMPLRARAPGAFQVTVDGTTGVAFLGAPPRGYVLVMQPDGTLLVALRAGDDGLVRWNLQLAPGVLLDGGVYRVQVQGRDAAGKAVPPQPLMLAIIRHRSP